MTGVADWARRGFIYIFNEDGIKLRFRVVLKFRLEILCDEMSSAASNAIILFQHWSMFINDALNLCLECIRV